MRIYYYILILSFLSLTTNAQTPYHWKLTNDDGLPDMEIYDLCQDSKGYMWIATDGGLCRYDGKNVKTYTHPLQKKTSAASIQEDTKGNIWYKNFAGQLFFIDTSHQVQLFQLPDSIKLNTYFQYYLTQTHLTITSSYCFYHYQFDSQQWTIDTSNNHLVHNPHFLPHNQSNDNSLLYIDCNNELWSKKNEQLSSKGIFTPSIIMSSNSLLSMGKDTVLLRTKNNIYIDHIDFISQLRKKALVLVQDGILRLYPKKDKLLIATQQGLLLFQKNKRTQVWNHKETFFKNKQISAVYIDRDENLWLGTLGGGVLVIPSLKMTYFDAQNSDLPNSKISALSKMNEIDLFIGMKGRLSKLNTESLKIKQYPPLGIYPVSNILVDKKRNQIFFNTKGNYTLSLSDKKLQINHVFAHHYAIYKEDQLLYGKFLKLVTCSLLKRPGFSLPPAHTFNENLDYIYYTYPSQFFHYTALINQKRISALWADLVDTSRFWAGANDSLFYWQDAIPYSISSNNGNPINPVDIKQTKDSIIWVATATQGLYGIKNEQEVYHFTTTDGLPPNICKKIAVDYPYIWIATNKGIVKLHPASKEINIYNQLDGLLTNQIDHIIISNKKVWAATTKGLISFDVNTPSLNPTPPLISITKWEVNDSSYALNEPVTLPFDQNNIKFTFQALALKSRNTYTYEYRLLGIDRLWIQQSSSTNFARFPSLNAGKYTFEVRARNEDGILSKRSPSISFYIQPPYWKTWWFSSLIGLVILAGIIFIIRLRYQSLQNKQATNNLITQLKMQALQAQMNPHFIFNAMSTIQSFWMYKDTKTALIYHAKFARLMRLIFNYSNEKSIPIKEEIDFLKLYIDLEKIRLKYAINTIFEIDPIFEEENLYIPPLLIQPIVENSFKHGFLHKEADGQLLIKLQKEGHYIKCLIEDDGVGRANAKSYNTWQDNTTNKSSSSFITQNRLNMLNQAEGQSPKKITYKITDLKDAQNNSLGTRTELWIPILDNFFVDFN
ncbi:MAG: histidine kinase [Aureispira sp.]|nr:histidine kinase [Aureispira sp.]